jgi:hypothetical protein
LGKTKRFEKDGGIKPHKSDAVGIFVDRVIVIDTPTNMKKVFDII